jgi:hypothetical protein
MLRPVNESDSAVVEQAKGALMLRYGIGSRESLAVLERWALEAGAPVRDVADALVNGICLGRVAPETDGTVRWLEQRLRGDVSDVRATAAEPAPLSSPEVVAASIPAPRPGTTPVAGHRQWRYTSAVHAARVLRSR